MRWLILGALFLTGCATGAEFLASEAPAGGTMADAISDTVGTAVGSFTAIPMVGTAVAGGLNWLLGQWAEKAA